MRVAPDQIAGQLKRGLKPVYVITGDEPLQVEESLDTVRAAARAQGFSDRVRLSGGSEFDWSELAAESDSLSLFATRKVIDLRLENSPGKPGHQALLRYCERIHSDNLLLLTLPQLTRAQKNAKWYQGLDRAGVTVEIWPVDPPRFPGWITQRARRRGVRLDADAAAVLAERCEGNLLAAAQYVDQLGVLYPEQQVDPEQVLAVAADSAKFDNFDFINYALAGQGARALRVLDGLREEGIYPVPVAGTMAWMVRELGRMADSIAAGQRANTVINKNPTWSRREAVVTQALRRHSAADWQRMLQSLEQIDRQSKTSNNAAAWDGMARLLLQIAGVTVFKEISL